MFQQRHDESLWDESVRASRSIDASAPTAALAQRELIRCATLAANSHNTQPWRFSTSQQHIRIAPDISRRCPAVDPDDHHLFTSLGCAAENIIQAAPAFGWYAEAAFDTAESGSVLVNLSPGPKEERELFKAIPRRQCTRTEYDGQSVAAAHLKSLENAGTGKGVRVLLFDAMKDREAILEYLLEGNTLQMQNRAFDDELKAWIRFSYGEALATGDGLFAKCSGNPVVPGWFGRLIFDRVFTVPAENKKIERQVRASSGIAVFISDASDKQHWVEAGRCYQRFALQATVLGLKLAFLNQPVEVPTVRRQFASYLNTPGRPDLVVRFGYGTEMPKSLRRPIEKVIVDA